MKRVLRTVIVVFFLCLSACSPIFRLKGTVEPEINDAPSTITAPTMPPLATELPDFEKTREADLPHEEKIDSSKTDMPDTYWVTNPASGVELFVQVIHAPKWDGENGPALVLIPGGVGWGSNLISTAKVMASNGFTVVVFDPDGRGRSAGSEDYDGYIHQDGLAAVIRFAQSLPEVEPGQVGLVSYSYGVTMATGVLARYPELGVRFLIDWEGPVDRYDTTTTAAGECQVELSKQNWQPCDDEAFWSQREAISFISQVQIPAYQRVQSETDHVQPDVTHAIRIVNQAVASGIGWVRLNDLPLNQTYDENDPPKMFPDVMDKSNDLRIAAFAVELMDLYGEQKDCNSIETK